MNQRSFSLFLILFGTILFAQEKLKVEYEIIPTYEAEQTAVKIITKNTYYYLLIDNEESEFIKIDKVDNSQPIDMSGAVFLVEMGPSGTLYKNTKSKKLVENRTFVDKNFLIKDSLPEIDWKITKEKKEISGYECYKATAEIGNENKTKVTAWYTPKLQFKTGPDQFWGLPGLILSVETELKHSENEIERAKYLALSIEVIESNERVSEPINGKIINEEGYQNYVNEYMKKQMEMRSGGVDKD